MARTAWVLLASVLVPLTAWGLVREYADPSIVAMAPLTKLFVELGLDFRLMITVVLAGPFSAVVVIASYIFMMRPRDSVALVFSAALITIFAFSSRAFLTFSGFPVLEYSLDVVFMLMAGFMVFLFGMFPSGRLIPRWAWTMAPLMLVSFLLDPRMGTTLEATMGSGAALSLRNQFAITTFLGAVGIGLAAQLHRYRRVSTAEQRQQTKLVVAPLGLVVGTIGTALIALTVSSNKPGAWIGWVIFVSIPALVATPVGVAAAVLRYRLFEVDRLISRTVTYTLVVAVLGLVFALGAVWIPTALGLGDSSTLLVTASTLAVAALFNPLRKRVQTSVDRRFNRSAYNADLVAKAFSAKLGQSLTTLQIVEEWRSTVDESLEPETSGIWLKSGRRPDGTAQVKRSRTGIM